MGDGWITGIRRGGIGNLYIEVSGSRIPVAFFFPFSLLGSSGWMGWADGFRQ